LYRKEPGGAPQLSVGPAGGRGSSFAAPPALAGLGRAAFGFRGALLTAAYGCLRLLTVAYGCLRLPPPAPSSCSPLRPSPSWSVMVPSEPAAALALDLEGGTTQFLSDALDLEGGTYGFFVHAREQIQNTGFPTGGGFSSTSPSSRMRPPVAW